MKEWVELRSDGVTTTFGVNVPGGVLIRCHSLYHQNTPNPVEMESVTFIPHVIIRESRGDPPQLVKEPEDPACLVWCGEKEFTHYKSELRTVPKGCVCNRDWGSGDIPPVCDNFKPWDIDPNICFSCSHEKGCHAK